MKHDLEARLFDEPPSEEPEEPEASGLLAQVVFDRPMRQVFTYLVPRGLAEAIEAGKRVLAPFGRGNHRTTGYCVGVIADADEHRPRSNAHVLKSLTAVLDDAPLLAPAMLELTAWIADYFYCGWGQVLEAALPSAVKHRRGTRWAVLLTPAAPEQRQGILTPKQERAFQVILEIGHPVEIKEITQAARCGAEVVKALIGKKWVSVLRERVHQRAPQLEPVHWDEPLRLNDHQQLACNRIVEALEQQHGQTFLLHGVTGSGKTEVYLQAIAEAVRRGREAIVLVPEISLTPQTIQRFRQRFAHVAVLHSHLSDMDRNWYWQRIANGEVQVVIGARSAVFAPCQRLGLIVIDEEHETTFKQETAPRYHARDVAVKRAELERVPLVLGSATPSLETWQAAESGKFVLLSLPQRVGTLSLPRVQLIDLRQEYRTMTGGLRALSRPLAEAVEATVRAGGQVILLLNRRGFSTALLCPSCGEVAMCQHCEVALTYHKDRQGMVCHSCDAEYRVPERCAHCGMPAIRYAGIGTERLEEEVARRFPDFLSARMDSDTMRSVGQYEKVLNDFRRGNIHILLGTQMIAKGLDFPNVHLVGVVTADTARHLPDFRASERTFQLIAQVAGRTGRGQTPGRVLVQTFNPDDPAILAASRHDYHQFVREEMPARKDYGYPPYQSLLRVIVRSKTETTVQQAAALLAERFRQHLPADDSVRVLGPAVAPVAKLRDFYRMHFQVHTPLEMARGAFLDRVFDNLTLPADAEYAIDVDPLNLL